MIRKIKLILTGILLTLSLSLPLSVPVIANAAVDTSSLCGGATLNITGTGGDCTGAGSSLNSTIKTVLDLFSAVVGIIAVIMIIIGGVKYITSGGSSDKTSSAKDTILFAIVGLVVVALAQIIVKFVLNKTNNL